MIEWVQANWVDGQMLHYESATSYPLECFHVVQISTKNCIKSHYLELVQAWGFQHCLIPSAMFQRIGFNNTNKQGLFDYVNNTSETIWNLINPHTPPVTRFCGLSFFTPPSVPIVKTTIQNEVSEVSQNPYILYGFIWVLYGFYMGFIRIWQTLGFNPNPGFPQKYPGLYGYYTGFIRVLYG